MNPQSHEGPHIPPITADQFNAACDRIRNAGQLITGSLYSVGSDGYGGAGHGSYCAIGALLNGPDGFTPEQILEFDSIASGACSDGDSYAAGLPDLALARLAAVYGLGWAAIDAIVHANDGSEPEGRTLAVLATLGTLVTQP